MRPFTLSIRSAIFRLNTKKLLGVRCSLTSKKDSAAIEFRKKPRRPVRNKQMHKMSLELEHDRTLMQEHNFRSVTQWRVRQVSKALKRSQIAIGTLTGANDIPVSNISLLPIFLRCLIRSDVTILKSNAKAATNSPFLFDIESLHLTLPFYLDYLNLFPRMLVA